MAQELTDDELLSLAGEVLEIEARAVDGLRARLDDAFVAACRLCVDTQGRIVVTGMGKSGHISGKIAATLASTGTPSFFMHPGEASHGDLGMFTDQDVLLAVSNSGETEEIITILPRVKRMGAPLITMTGNPSSTLAEAADIHLDVSVAEEACPLNLAPTASTTATLAMGDALAVALLKIRGFTAEDFALSHPSGSLGKRLILRVADVMRTGDAMPAVLPNVKLTDGLLEMTQKGLGMTAVVDDQERRARFEESITRVDSLGRLYLFTKLLASGWSARIYERTCHHAAKMRLTRVGLALLEYRKETGSWPESLDALIEKFGGSIPLNPLTNEAFRYERRGSKVRLEAEGAVTWEEVRDEQEIVWEISQSG